MPASPQEQMLFDSAVEVLETMFFTAVVGDAPVGELNDGSIAARIVFHGTPSGEFRVQLPLHSAQTIACSFLGLEEEEISDGQISDVTCELANILCGAVLSRLEAGGRFDLGHPELDPRPFASRADGQTFSHALELEGGTITMWLELVQPV